MANKELILQCASEEWEQLKLLQEICTHIPDEREHLFWCDYNLPFKEVPTSFSKTGRPTMSWMLREPDLSQPAGYIELHGKGTHCVLAHLFVPIRFRRRGIGQSLWQMALCMAFQYWPEAIAVCHCNNFASKSLQLQQGFVERGTVEGRSDLELLAMTRDSFESRRDYAIAELLSKL